MTAQEEKPRKPRGFQTLSKERLSEIARMGGKSVDPKKRSFSRDRKMASKAGAKGGANAPSETRSFSTNPELARAAGKKGGSIIGKRRKKAEETAS